MAEDRIAALRQRMKPPTEEEKDEAPESRRRKTKRRSTRARQTFYLEKTITNSLDKAFKDAAAELYTTQGIEIDKADFIEACLTYALARQDDIKGYIAIEHGSKVH